MGVALAAGAGENVTVGADADTVAEADVTPMLGVCDDVRKARGLADLARATPAEGVVAAPGGSFLSHEGRDAHKATAIGKR